MRKSLMFMMIGLLMLGACGNVWAGSVVAADLACTNPAGCVQTYEISDGAVTTSKIATGAVTSANIAPGSVTAATIANGAVTDTQISGTISGSKLGPHTHNGSDIADGTITSSKLGYSAVNTGTIADGAVTTNKVVDSAVTTGKLADWSVNSAKIADFSVTDTKITSNAVTTAKVADGAVTDAKISGTIAGSKLGAHTHDGSDIVDGTITSSKISDGAITDAKITGPISAAKLEKLANVVVVAKAGGDFTSIQSAMDSINPSAENPYIIKVMPGTYVEYISMKSYIHLMGAGRDVTTITSPSDGGTLLSCSDITNVTISGFTIRSGSYSFNGHNPRVEGININNSSFVTIEDNSFTGAVLFAVYLNYSGTSDNIFIRNNLFTGMGAVLNSAITLESPTGHVVIKDNYFMGNWRGITVDYGTPIIEKNVFTGNSTGIYSYAGGVPTIKDNVISGNSNGVQLRGDASVIHNKITDNTPPYDVLIIRGPDAPSDVPHISFNIVNNLCLWGNLIDFVGKFNLKTDGTEPILIKQY